MTYFVASLVALAIGPLLALAARRLRVTTIAVDAFVLVSLGGLVLLHILPHAIEGGGWAALGVAVAAFFVTGLAEKGLHGSAEGGRSSRLLLGLALTGLFLHAVVDGLAVTETDLHQHAHVHADGTVHHGSHGESQAPVWGLAVLIHRIPFSASLWWIIAPLLGVRTALLTVLIMAAGTIVGFSSGQSLLASAPSTIVAMFEGLLAGTLMHVVLHADLPPPPKGAPAAERWLATLIGLGAGVAAVLAAGAGHDHGTIEGGGEAFLQLALQSAPALLLAYLAVGVLHSFVPGNWIRRSSRGKPFGDAIRGVLIGMPLPVCSCGVVPIYRSLVRGGSSVAAGVAFLIATPEIEIAAVLLTWELLGPAFAAARVGAAALLAILVALWVSRIARNHQSPASEPDDQPDAVAEPAALPRRIREVFTHGFGEAVESTAAWILVGLGLAAMLQSSLDPSVLTGLPAGLDVPIAALIGLPLYVCASGSTPLAAVLVAAGLSPGAAIAFLLTGPATNVTTFGVVRSLHGARAAIAFSSAVAIGAVGIGYLVNLTLGSLSSTVVALEHEQVVTPLRIACAAVLAIAILAAILRRGVRGFLAPLFDVPNVGERDHQHGGHHHHGDESPPDARKSCCLG